MYAIYLCSCSTYAVYIDNSCLRPSKHTLLRPCNHSCTSPNCVLAVSVLCVLVAYVYGQAGPVHCDPTIICDEEHHEPAVCASDGINYSKSLAVAVMFGILLLPRTLSIYLAILVR